MYSGIETDPMIGKKFGRLTVIQFIEKDEHRKAFYKCLCDCGQISVTRKDYLLSGRAKSCGCLRNERLQDPEYHRSIAGHSKIDMVGHEYGSWVVLSESGRNKRGEVTFLCRCECGTEKVILGRSIRNNSAKRHCGCKDPVKKEKPKKRTAFFKRINVEEYAKDLYCYYLDGMSLVDIARENGHNKSGFLSRLFNEFIQEYRDNSIKRREKAETHRMQVRARKWSKRFRFENEFQNYCSDILKSRNIKHKMNDREQTGFEIDILTDQSIIELKVSTKQKDLFTAFGQISFNHAITQKRPYLLIPSDCIMKDDIRAMYSLHNIKIITDIDLLSISSI
jgi:hypothetical protein